jgi:ribosomal protein L11 methyltransferase
MRWHELTIRTTEEAVEPVCAALHDMGAGGVSIEDSAASRKPHVGALGEWYDLPPNGIPEGCAVVKAYFAETSDVRAVEKRIAETLRMLRDEVGLDIGEGRVEMHVVDDEDWANAWKRYYKPLRVSAKLTVKPVWEPYVPESAEEKVIELDPGMAFGTGTHPTTSLCLKALERFMPAGADAIDVGTGSGILAIAAAKLGARRVLAIDLDPVAVSSAKANVQLNGLTDRVTVIESDLLGAIRDPALRSRIGVLPPVGVVVGNLLAEIIMRFVDDVYEALEPGGLYIASGIYVNKEAAVEHRLRGAGFTIAETCREQDWIAFVARKGR